MRALFTSFLAAVLCPLTVLAEGEPVQLRIRGFAGESPIPDVFLENDMELLPLPLLPYTPSEPLALKRDNLELRFVRTPPGAVDAIHKRIDQLLRETPEAGHPDLEKRRAEEIAALARQPLATVSLSKDNADVLLGFIPDRSGNGGMPYRVQIISNHVDVFPEGSIRLMNWSPFEVAYLLGEEQKTLQSGESVFARPALDAKHRSRIELAARRKDSGEWVLFYQAPVSLRPRHRATLVFAFTSSYLEVLKTEGERGPDGKLRPEMIVIPWTERPLPPP